jgi:hypothetical protein
MLCNEGCRYANVHLWASVSVGSSVHLWASGDRMCIGFEFYVLPSYYYIQRTMRFSIMTCYLTASIPNSFLTAFKCVKIKSLTKEQFIQAVSEPDYEADYDDTLPPLKLKKKFVMSLGHQNVCDILSSILDNGATLGFKPLIPKFEVNRIDIKLESGDGVFCFLFIPPRRLAEGERWNESDFNNMEIKFLVLYEGTN